MYTLTTDETCTRCGTCVAECPYAIIALAEEGRPAHVPGGPDRCTACGHCVAVCPTGSIHIAGVDLLPPPAEPSEAQVSAAALARYLRSRRSMRRYRPDPVPRETIEGLLDVIRYAPSGMNAHPCSWIVIHQTAEVRRLTALAVDWARSDAARESPLKGYFDFPGMVRKWEAGDDEICRHAPHLVICHAPKRATTASIDGVVALAHLDVAAPAFGLATCWAGLFHLASLFWVPLREALALPPGHVPVYSMMLGYPATAYLRVPQRKRLVPDWR